MSSKYPSEDDLKQKFNAPTNLCRHHSSKFKNNPKKLASSIMKALYTPAENTNKKSIFPAISVICQNELCQQCAYHLATQLPSYLIMFYKNETYYLFGTAPNMRSAILALLLQILPYPSLAQFYFHHTKTWKYMLRLFSECCAASAVKLDGDTKWHQNMQQMTVKLIVTPFKAIHDYTIFILHCGNLMQHSKYWRKRIFCHMYYVAKACDHVINGRDDNIRKSATEAILGVQCFIFMFLHYKHGIPRKLQRKYDGYISKYRKEITKIYDSIGHNEVDCYKNMIKTSCFQAMQIMDGAGIEIVDRIKNMYCTTWKMSKQGMKCLWIKCEKKAIDLKSSKLRKCKRCRVARYCSKYCQKRDWKYGNHKQICDKFVEMRL